MRYIFSLFFLFIATLVYANENYPSLFSEQGTPLFKAADNFSKLKEYAPATSKVINYAKSVNEVKTLGFKADSLQEKKDIQNYLKSLRLLQKQHDEIIKLTIMELLKSIKKDNYKEFTLLADVSTNYFKDQDRLKEHILAYYKKNRKIYRITSLDKLLKIDRTTVKRYSQTTNFSYNNDDDDDFSKNSLPKEQNIIVVSRAGCPYCDKAKALLSANGKYYREVNSNSSEGSSLLRKHGARGVPLVIIDNVVIKGYSKSGILRALK
jgi:glutaredoxin